MLMVKGRTDTSGITQSIKDAQTRRATAKAARAGIKIINTVARALAPKRLGNLKKAQGYKAVKGKKGKTISYAVQGAKTKYRKVVRRSKHNFVSAITAIPALYDHLVIGGVRPHSIRKGSQLGREKDHYKIRLRVRKGQGVGKPHPGHGANPYRASAYNATKQHVDRVTLEVLAREINLMFEANSKKLVTFK